MNAQHYKDAHWVGKGVFDSLSSFSEFESRVNDIFEEKDRGDVFEIFVEGYLATQTITQHVKHWVVGGIPVEMRERFNLPNDGTGIDGRGRTSLPWPLKSPSTPATSPASPGCRCRTPRRRRLNSPVASPSSASRARWSTALPKRTCRTRRSITTCPNSGPFWSTVAELDVPFYLHPRLTIPSRTTTYEGHRWLYSQAWDFGSETATQALRLIGSGLFDEFPRLQVVLGHLGERIPFDMWRIDNLMEKTPVSYPAKKRVSEYMQENFHLTTSGQFHDAPFQCALAEMGAARLMFSVDYPYEEMAPAAAWFDNTKLSDADRLRIGRTNAIELFKLDLA